MFFRILYVVSNESKPTPSQLKWKEVLLMHLAGNKDCFQAWLDPGAQMTLLAFIFSSLSLCWLYSWSICVQQLNLNIPWPHQFRLRSLKKNQLPSKSFNHNVRASIFEPESLAWVACPSLNQSLWPKPGGITHPHDTRSEATSGPQERLERGKWRLNV